MAPCRRLRGRLHRPVCPRAGPPDPAIRLLGTGCLLHVGRSSQVRIHRQRRVDLPARRSGKPQTSSVRIRRLVPRPLFLADDTRHAAGGPIAAAWAVLNYLGWDGYVRIAGELFEAVDQLKDGIRAIDGLSIVGDPPLTILIPAA